MKPRANICHCAITCAIACVIPCVIAWHLLTPIAFASAPENPAPEDRAPETPQTPKPAPAPTQTLADVAADIEKAWRRDKSVSTRLKLTVNAVSPEQTLKINQSGAFDFQMKDGVFKFRSDLDHTGFLQTDVSSQEFKQSNATICNGQLVYTITDGQIAKSQPDDAFYVYGGKPMLDFLGKDMDLRLGLDAVIDGQDVYTILGYPSGYSPDAKDIVTNAFAKDTGFVIHQESRDANGEITHLLHYTKIKKDAEFKADHFDFKPPPGTPVKDYTGGLPTAGP